MDGVELVGFSWIEMYQQEADISRLYRELPESSSHELEAIMKPTWDTNCTYYEKDFLNAALKFHSMSIKDALASENYIIRILAILDRRIGKRTLTKIAESKEYIAYPNWIREFYELRLMSI